MYFIIVYLFKILMAIVLCIYFLFAIEISFKYYLTSVKSYLALHFFVYKGYQITNLVMIYWK